MKHVLRFLLLLFLLSGSYSSAHALRSRYAGDKPARGYETAGYAVDGTLAKGARAAVRRTTQVRYRSASGIFMFHYDTSGTQAVPKGDADGDGVPDYVETAAWVADSVRNAYGRLGFYLPFADGGAGGGTEYDIYMNDLASQRVYGYTYPGSNGYMEIDRAYSDPSVYLSLGTAGLRVTLAHEMFHSIQFLYPTGGASPWWMEMTATFMEDVMYDGINDYYQYLRPDWFYGVVYENPSVSLTDFPNNSVHPYSAAVFLKFLWERFGRDVAITAVRRTFEGNASDVAAIVNTLATTLDEPMRDVLTEFWVWSYFTGPRARPNQFFFEAADLRPAPLDTTSYGYDTTPYKVAADRATIGGLSRTGSAAGTVTAQFLGARLLRIEPDGSTGGFRAHLNPQGHKWAWRIAVTRPERVTVLEPVVVNPTTGESEIVVAGDNWKKATDIVLVGANGETFGDSIRFSYSLTFDVALDVAEPKTPPSRTVLRQNAPNPFNPITTIPFTLDGRTPVRLTIYDITGKLVRTLVDGDVLGPGEHRFTWDGTTDEGRAAGAGGYVAVLMTPRTRQARRMILLR